MPYGTHPSDPSIPPHVSYSTGTSTSTSSEAQQTTMVNTAPVKWAQRSDSIYVTICLPDVTGESIELDAEHFLFK